MARFSGVQAGLLQFLWLFAVLWIVMNLITLGTALSAYSQELIEDGTTWFNIIEWNFPPNLSDVSAQPNQRFFYGTSLLLIFFTALSMFFAELGCVCITDAAQFFGTIKGRGFYYLLLAFGVVGLSGDLGIITAIGNVGIGVIHIFGGCCVCRSTTPKLTKEQKRKTLEAMGVAYDEQYEDVAEANPGWTSAASRITRNFVDSFSGWGGGEDPNQVPAQDDYLSPGEGGYQDYNGYEEQY